MESLSREIILEQIKEFDSQINSKHEYFNTIIHAIEKKKEGMEHACVIFLRMLNYVPMDGTPTIDKEDVTIRLNRCTKWIEEANIIIPTLESTRTTEITPLIVAKNKLINMLNE
jgi:hypothetical protein